MHRKGFFMALGLTLLLAGCANTQPGPRAESPQLAQGRAAFMAEDYERAAPLLQQAAMSGNPQAQYALGYMYFYGLGVKQDRTQALALIREAAAGGDQRAVQALGEMAASKP
ncbi:tetratricopeptide repeat protein [Alkalilimnicola sp. S0819]|uniref:tetratricopeptide repeat protein n=1 Tax=Alkalilimnicola sp. S0819 TaxID=2613922 RepID=UPI0012624CF3|nr:SEL1-like repeat protein [Alkalilimnicola sp. S0819]KAB7623012.1 SEL1-like repeat protein [Alkalilimnicola sp. S0819]MPQ17124.1 sel1 repeat family protein [Alkalilimnicola sp. S0819]